MRAKICSSSWFNAQAETFWNSFQNIVRVCRQRVKILMPGAMGVSGRAFCPVQVSGRTGYRQ
ncbi:MAG: hypothetical protein ABFD70_09475 [Syntrophaceae bacterium]|nr:hypothetical protein [Deltaproteobacteria bacterium]